MGEGFETDEWGGAWLPAGILYGNDGSDYLVRMTGNGNGGGTETLDGSKILSMSIYLQELTIAFGAYNNKASHR